MTVARILFLAKYRVPHACMALQFDRFLEGIDRTCICSPVPKEELWPIFERYNIDTKNFDYCPDSEIFERYPQIDHWVFDDDYRGWWLRQQAIKLSFLDYLSYDVMLMQDPDTFMVEPYRCYDNGTLNYMVLENTKHSYGYYKVLENALGIHRQTPHCFVTEFVPVLKEDITALRLTLEERNQRHWLDAIIENVPLEPTMEPWAREGNFIRWFSEYEFVGNWAMSRHPVNLQFQRRFEYDSLDKLQNFDPTKFNCFADAVPDLSLSLQFDWDKGITKDFEHYMAVINSRIS